MPRGMYARKRKSGRNGNAALAEYQDDAAGATAPIVLEPEPVNVDDNPEPADLHALPFFDHLRGVAPSDWGQNLMVYLYRLSPQVQNPQGMPAYIDRYVQPFDDATVKDDHGGGKYRAMLKDLRQGQAVRTYEFFIAGDPKYKPGQTMVGPGPVQAQPVTPANGQPAAPSPVAEIPVNAIAQVVREVAALVKQNPQRSDDDILSTVLAANRRAMESAIDIMASAAKQNASSSTGNPLADKLLDRLISRFDEKPATPAAPKTLIEQVSDLVPLMKLLRGGSDGAGVTDELTMIKDLVGADTLRDLIVDRGRDRGDDWRTKLFEFGTKVVEAAPGMMEKFVAIQAAGFERALTVAEYRRTGQRPANVATAPAPAANVTVMPAPTIMVPAPPISTQGTAQMAAAAGVSEDAMLDAILQVVVTSFDAGDTGEDAGLVIKRAFPQIVPMFAGMLADLDKVMIWARSQRVLAAIATHEHFPAFLADFAAEILRDENAPDDERAQVGAAGAQG